MDPRLCAANVFAVYIDALGAYLNAERPDRAALGASFATRLDSLLRGVLSAPRPSPRRRNRPR